MTDFEYKPIDHEDVVSVLLDLRNRGWHVRKVPSEDRTVTKYAIDLGSRGRMYIEHWVELGKHYVVLSDEWNTNHTSHDEPEDIEHLRAMLERRARSLRVELYGDTPRATRLSKSEPASNIGRLVSLARGRPIYAVFDNYLDTRGISVLLSMHALGASFDPSLRLLTGVGYGQKMQPQYVLDAFKQLCVGPSAEIRKVAGKEHRRFMLLAGHDVLIFGNSLNQMAHNEAAHVEPNAEDSAFFEAEWQNAGPP